MTGVIINCKIVFTKLLGTFLDYESSTTGQRLLRLFFRHYLVGQENEAQKRKTTFPQSLSEEKAEQELDPDF